MAHSIWSRRIMQSAATSLRRVLTPAAPWQPEPLPRAVSRSRALANGALLVVALVVGVVVLMRFAPDNVGYDYEIFHDVGVKLLHGRPIYDEDVQSGEHRYRLLYLPHAAILMAPLSLVPQRLAWAILCVLSVLTIFLIGRRWRLSSFQVVLIVTALPTLRTLYLGNVDALVTGTILLPVEWQIVGVLMKPQVAVGLAPRSLTRKTAWFLLAAMIVLAIVYGFWDSLLYLSEARALSVNVWHAINPWQMVVGLAVFGVGMWRKDERLLLGCSPFLSPYVTLGSLVPVWMAICATTNRWVSVALWGANYLFIAWVLYHPG